jgi:hypothetical protein
VRGLAGTRIAVRPPKASTYHPLVPPTLCGADLDLANSGWLATTGALLAILPVLALVLG